MKDELDSPADPGAPRGSDSSSGRTIDGSREIGPDSSSRFEVTASEQRRAPIAEAEKPTTPDGIQPTLLSDSDLEYEVDPDARSANDYVGQIIDGRYHVLSIIAQGGMGVVYRCKHRTIDKAVAIKILRPDLAADRDVTERFMIEAKAASSIGNRHIIDVTDFGELPDGAMYLAMEYLEGLPLSKRIHEEGVLPVAEILFITRQIAAGLHAAHEGGIVHRDLKPDNIFLVREEHGAVFVKILDFGIAKVASNENKLTRAGKIFGTPHYMAPEQGSGSGVDRRTDVYSLGVMLYEMASGRVPFDAENPLGILTQHMYVSPIPPNEREDALQQIPVALEAVILKCLSKDPLYRYVTMQELAEDLQRVERGEVPLAVGDLLWRGSDELPLKRLQAASVPPSPPAKPSNIGRWLGLGLSLALMVTLVAVVVYPRGGALLGAAREHPKPLPSLVKDAGAKRVASRSVALVLSPIDAHVFDGSRDLGTMPISIKISAHEVATLQIRRDGFVTAQVRVDGSTPKLIVELQPIPGATPKVPVPERSREDTTHRDAGTRVITLEKKFQESLGLSRDPTNPNGVVATETGGAATDPGALGGTGGADNASAQSPDPAPSATASSEPEPPSDPSSPSPAAPDPTAPEPSSPGPAPSNPPEGKETAPLPTPDRPEQRPSDSPP